MSNGEGETVRKRTATRRPKLGPLEVSGPLIEVAIDDPVPFACSRSGYCCTGRLQAVSNLIMHQEFRAMWEVWKDQGKKIYRIVPEIVLRGIGVSRHHPAGRGPKSHDRVVDPNSAVVGDPGTWFRGLMLRMVPDATERDGDRCTFLSKDGQYACLWHHSRAQPMACALAPLAVHQGDGTSEPRFFYPLRRKTWCAGMAGVLRGDLPGTTVRAILETNHGEERLRELSEFQEAYRATAGASLDRNRVSPSPLAELYIREVPELGPLLEGY